ncbi:MAG: galactokinase [Rhodospirillaceae bacterium]|nr:galactokinase [Rhodospirillaceae bacterium]
MIIARSPLRISLGGGGTDLPSYYRHHEGFLIAASIDRYVYITLQKTFEQQLIVKYSQVERVPNAKSLRHPIVREALTLLGMENEHLEITSIADIPTGSGLGSSGSFTVALLKALHTLNDNLVSRNDLAEQACHIEIDRLNEPIGKQDQYIAAYGGITCFRFTKDDRVVIEPLRISTETMGRLQTNFLLFHTGISRKANSILKEQNDKTLETNQDMVDNLHYVKEMGFRSKEAFESGELHEIGAIMHEHWQHKKKRSKAMSSPQIDEWYKFALENGAIGGKVIGAGGGGFLMLYSEDTDRLRAAMAGAGVREVVFRLEAEGTSTIVL